MILGKTYTKTSGIFIAIAIILSLIFISPTTSNAKAFSPAESPAIGVSDTVDQNTVASSGNLLTNPNMEEIDGDSGLPVGWEKDSWLTGDEDTVFSIEDDEQSDIGHCLHIKNISPNDARLIQTISVSSNKLYKISGMIKAKGVPNGNVGASISVLNIKDNVLDLDDTYGEWQHFEFYGNTVGGQTSITIALRLGGYSNETVGEAWFDNISIVEYDQAPSDVIPISLESTYQDSSDDEEEITQQELIKAPQTHATIILVSLLWMLLCYTISKRVFNRQHGLLTNKNKPEISNVLIIVFASALVIRLVLAATSYGYTTDINCFKGWADHLANNGTWSFYDGSIFADYPPGYMYVLLILGFIQDVFAIPMDSSSMLVLIKLPAIIADVVMVYFVYSIASRKMSSKWALALASLVAFSPATILNTSLWGQVDSILVVLLLWSGQCLLDKKNLKACIIFVVALLIKPQALFFGPIILLWFIYEYINNVNKRGVLLDILKCVGVGIGLFIIAILPFWGTQEPLWIFGKYFSTVVSYPYASVNAFNLFALTGGNWAKDTTEFLLLSYKTWGYIFIVTVVAIGSWFFLKSKDKKHLWLVSAFIFIGIFTLAHNMHERYIYPAIFFLIMSYLETQDKRILLLSVGFSITFIFNTGVILVLGNMLSDDIGLIIGSLVQVCLFAYLAYVCFDICIRKRIHPILKKQDILSSEEDEYDSIKKNKPTKLNWSKKDRLLISGLTLVYAIIALINLGSTVAPSTYWRSQEQGESVAIQFDGEHVVSSMRYYGGIGDGRFVVDLVQSDGSSVYTADVDQEYGNMYKWEEAELLGSATGVVITTSTPDVWLIETAFYDSDGQIIPVVSTSETVATQDEKSSGTNLVDEQSLIPENPTFMDEMYFDEIYHARTAYEHINGLEYYETTHPPLGKLFIAAGISIFGMNPFGWRIVGTIFGIMMIPLMYLFGKRIFKSTRYAFIGAFLLSFECMHFVQTRIATIDVYGVFFIILMFYFMYRYYTTSYYSQPLKSSIIPLGLCGLAFGLGIASKWIGLYSGAGLAILFFMSLYNRFKEYKTANGLLQTDQYGEDEYLLSVREKFKPAAIKTLLWAVLFFIVIPIAIYIASYIPIFLAKEGNYAFSDLWEMQLFMFNYHSFLTATHPFSSQWWSWPFVARPIWYYANYSLQEGYQSSIAAFGNVAVWWAGFVSVVALLINTAKTKLTSDTGKLVIIVALACSFLPWVLVTRATFIYHYFASVPFIILATVYVIRFIETKYGRYKWVVKVYLIVVLLVFVFFYPAMSGMQVPDWYAQIQQIMASWHFYLQ